MATRSIIARKINDKESLAIYCHFDGYLEHNGEILQKYYDTPEKVEKLISLGDLCILGKKNNPDPSKPHTRLNPQKDVCIYYGRDMKTPNSEPTITQTSQLANLSNWAEHVYWYDSSKWNHSIMYEDKSLHFKPLEEEMELVKPYIEWMKKEKDKNKLLEDFIMEKEKPKFDEDKFEEYLGEFLWENDIYDGHAGWVCMEDIIDEDLKRNGIKSKYIRVAESIVDSSENFIDADYYKIDEYMDGTKELKELNKAQVYDEFVSTHYFSDEMQDPKIAPDVYSYIYYHSSDEEFRWFEDLRKDKNGNCKDAVDLDALHKELGIEYEPKIQEERER